MEDLAIPCDGPGFTVRLGRDLGEVTLMSAGRLPYAGKGGRAWKKVIRRTRAKVLMAWVRDAASVARGRLRGGDGWFKERELKVNVRLQWTDGDFRSFGSGFPANARSLAEQLHEFVEAPLRTTGAGESPTSDRWTRSSSE